MTIRGSVSIVVDHKIEVILRVHQHCQELCEHRLKTALSQKTRRYKFRESMSTEKFERN